VTILRAFADAYRTFVASPWLTPRHRRAVPVDSPSLASKTPAGGHAPDAVIQSGVRECGLDTQPARRSSLDGWLAA